MIITDYLYCKRTIEWDYARQMGITYAVIRLPDDKNFDVCDVGHWKQVYKQFTDYGLQPIVIEPLPNHLHDHIKSGDEMRDECIEKVIGMLPIMEYLKIRTICFNFMAYIGWTRTNYNIEERGGAKVTGFRLADFKADTPVISQEELWSNYKYFIEAVLPHAEKHGIQFALHPDDPPVEQLGNVSRIMTSFNNIWKAIHLVESDYLGVTFCQACYSAMGENFKQVISSFAKEKKIFFIHFRDIVGVRDNFRESFHDNGQTDMAKMLKIYKDCGVHVPIRVDHVPTMAGERTKLPGYGKLGRLYAIGYLRGMLDILENSEFNI